MKKVIRETDEKLGIMQVTIADERWYTKQVVDSVTKLPTIQYVPSVTWIAGHYPKGIGFYKWLGEKGWDEGQGIKVAAGNKRSKVHHAINSILNGAEVRIDSKFTNPETDQLEELTLEECDAIKSFVDWRVDTEKEYIVEFLAWDVTVFSEKYGYGGTIDAIVRLTNRKTGEVRVYIVEVSEIKLAILQIGYRRNRAGYKWNEIEDQFPLFLAARQIWAKECEGQSPKRKDYPIVLSPARPVAVEPQPEPKKEKVTKAKK